MLSASLTVIDVPIILLDPDRRRHPLPHPSSKRWLLRRYSTVTIMKIFFLLEKIF
jgi:hypothetical protein